MALRPDLETAASISVAGCDACTCGAITVRLHDRRGAIFAAASIGPDIAEAFLEQVRAAVDQQRPAASVRSDARGAPEMASTRKSNSGIVERPGPQREALTRDMMMVCAGHPAGRALGACLDVLASVIGLMATEIGAADAVYDALPADLKATIFDNWDELSRLQAQASQRGRA